MIGADHQAVSQVLTNSKGVEDVLLNPNTNQSLYMLRNNKLYQLTWTVTKKPTSNDKEDPEETSDNEENSSDIVKAADAPQMVRSPNNFAEVYLYFFQGEIQVEELLVFGQNAILKTNSIFKLTAVPIKIKSSYSSVIQQVKYGLGVCTDLGISILHKKHFEHLNIHSSVAQKSQSAVLLTTVKGMKLVAITSDDITIMIKEQLKGTKT